MFHLEAIQKTRLWLGLKGFVHVRLGVHDLLKDPLMGATMLCGKWQLLVVFGVVIGQVLSAQDKTPYGMVCKEADCQTHEHFFDSPHPVSVDSGSVNTDALFLNYISANSKPEGDMPRELAITPDGTTVLIVNRDTDNVTFYDVMAQQISHSVQVGDFPVDVEVSPNGNLGVVPNVFDNSISIIDLTTMDVVDVPVTGDQPYRVAITPDSQFAIVGVINDAVNSSFSIVNLDSNMEVQTFASVPQGVIGFFATPESGISGSFYTDFAMSPDGSLLVVPDRGNDLVAVYDAQTGVELNSIPTVDAPTSVDIAADGSIAVIGHQGTVSEVSVINLGTLAVSHTVSTPETLRNQVIRITPDNQYVIGSLLNEVVFVELASGLSNVISTGSPGDIEISFDGQYVFVSNFNSRVIEIATQSLVDTITFAPAYDAIASPVELRAFALNNRFREDLHVYDINGSAGFFEGRVLSGEPEEGDGTRTVALTSDGRTAVAANVTSDNVTIFDTCSGNIVGYVPTGERSLGIAITPDNTTAVVCNAEDNTVSIIDIVNGVKLVDLPVSQRPGEVAISPDGQMAYVTTVAGTDRVHFIELDGADSNVVGSLIAGQMGSILYTFNVVSGIAVSPDGSVIAACISFDDELLLIDAATQNEIARVPVGDFPIRVRFSQDSSRAFVTNSFGDSLSVVAINGASSQVVQTIGGIEFPLDVVIDSSGTFAYVASFDFNNPSLKVIDFINGNQLASISLDDRPRRIEIDLDTDELFVATTGGELVILEAEGAATAISESIPLTSGPSDVALKNRVAVVANPIPDGIDVVERVLRGDVNLDGVVDLLDVAPFVDLLVNGPFQVEGDVNKDGVIDLLDVAPFVDVLVGS